MMFVHAPCNILFRDLDYVYTSQLYVALKFAYREIKSLVYTGLQTEQV